MRDKIAKDRGAKGISNNHGTARLTSAQVSTVRLLRRRFNTTPRELAKHYGVDVKTMRNILNHKTYKLPSIAEIVTKKPVVGPMKPKTLKEAQEHVRQAVAEDFGDIRI